MRYFIEGDRKIDGDVKNTQRSISNQKKKK